jgi:hypothetical protein
VSVSTKLNVREGEAVVALVGNEEAIPLSTDAKVLRGYHRRTVRTVRKLPECTPVSR